MNTKNKYKGFDARHLLQAILAWGISALVLLILASLIVLFTEMKASGLAYISSTISFLTAFFACMVAGARQKGSNWKMALLCGMSLSILLLMSGFLASGEHMTADGVIRVVSFTVVGSLFGSFLAPTGLYHQKRKLNVKTR